MARFSVLYGVILLWNLWFAADVWAGTPALSGQIVDEAGQPIAEVDVLVTDTLRGWRAVVATDGSGTFQLSALRDPQGSSHRLRLGQRLRLSAWKPGVVPKESVVRVSRRKARVEPIVLTQDIEPALSRPVFFTTLQELESGSPLIDGDSRRGE